MTINQEKDAIKWEKKEWFFIFAFLIALVVLNIIFIFINWFIWKEDSVYIVTTVTTIFNLAVCLSYWFIAMKNKLKRIN